MSDLKEIKKDRCGSGLLIENDGYITTNKDMLREGIENSEEWYVPNPFIVGAVFQKFGVKNANGRIYPEDILKREIEKYQQKVRDRRALGECYPSDAMILTYEYGWKNISEVEEGELIFTLNTETDEIEIKPIIRKIEKDYDGDMVRLFNRNINDLVTPQHKFPVYSSKTKSFSNFYEAEDLLNKSVKGIKTSFIPKRGEWNMEGDESVILDGDDKEDTIEIKMSEFMAFIGLYLGNGMVNEENERIYIYQDALNDLQVIKKIEELLNGILGFGAKKNRNARTIYYVIENKYFYNYLKNLGDLYNRFIPTKLKNQSKENLHILYDWFAMTNARIKGDKRNEQGISMTDDVFSFSKKLVLDLNEIQLKIGYNGMFHEEDRKRGSKIGNIELDYEKSKKVYFTLRSLTKGIRIDDRFLQTSKEQYKGKVYCVEVENHTWFVMQNGKTHWTGNCNHPDSSNIDLSRVSHNIIELHWEGRTLVGKMEIFTSYGFRKFGVVSTCGDMVANLILSGYKIGVSSRAVGSVEEKLGVLYVGNDLELLAFDVVADPSTNNAFIYTDENDKKMYVENKEDEKDKLLSSKISKLKNLL